MAKKINPKKMKRARNKQFVQAIKRKQKENEELKRWKRRSELPALRVTLLPQKRHVQAVLAP